MARAKTPTGRDENASALDALADIIVGEKTDLSSALDGLVEACRPVAELEILFPDKDGAVLMSHVSIRRIREALVAIDRAGGLPLDARDIAALRKLEQGHLAFDRGDRPDLRRLALYGYVEEVAIPIERRGGVGPRAYRITARGREIAAG